MSSAPTMGAISTELDGVVYRSRLEARWALLLKTLAIEAHYEPEGYDFDGVKYLPDFWLPRFDAFLEIKPNQPTPAEWEKVDLLTMTTGKLVLFAIGPPAVKRDDGSGAWVPVPLSSAFWHETDGSMGPMHNIEFHWLGCQCGQVYLWGTEEVEDGTLWCSDWEFSKLIGEFTCACTDEHCLPLLDPCATKDLSDWYPVWRAEERLARSFTQVAQFQFFTSTSPRTGGQQWQR